MSFGFVHQFNNYKLASSAFAIGRKNSANQKGNSVSLDIGWASGGAAVAGTFLAIVASSNTGFASVSGGSAWTLLNVGASSYTIYYKICGGSEPTTYSVSYFGSAKQDGVTASIIEILLPNASNPDDKAYSTSTATCPAATSINAADIGLILWSGDENLPTPPAGWTTQTSLGDAKSVSGTLIAAKVGTGSGSISPGAFSLLGGLVGTILVKP